MKPCIACGVEKELTEFYPHKRMADGRLNKCKGCCKVHTRANYNANRVSHAAYERKRQTDPERRRKKVIYTRRHRENNPEKWKARQAVAHALRSGRLRKQPCRCGATKVQAHHADYSKPLEVEWVCFACHREEKHGQKVISTG